MIEYTKITNNDGLTIVIRNNNNGTITSFLEDSNNADYQAYLEHLQTIVPNNEE